MTNIYYLKCPLDGLIKWVGKADDVHIRYLRHLGEARRGERNIQKNKWVNALRELGKQPEIVLAETVTQDEWQKAEKRHIKMLKEAKYNLFNIAPGGLGGGVVIGTKIPELQRSRIAKANEKYKRPVIQIDVDGNKIREFSGVNEAARILNVTATKVSAVCRGRRKSVGGYRLTYKHDN